MTSTEDPAAIAEADDSGAVQTALPAVDVEPDAVLAGAVEIARAAAHEVGGEHVGEHVGLHAEPASEGAHVVTHAFATTLPGYVGWHWAVTLGRVEGDDDATVDEVVLLPGGTALMAPAWVPWEERVRPGDLSPGDLLPARVDDVRLVPAYLLSDDPAVGTVGLELGLGREQVMSRDGRLDAAERWYEGARGPDSPMARQAPAPCGTCGFFLPLAGSLAAGFGVCGNEVTDSDGAVVSVEYGCGAHSGVVAEATRLSDAPEVVWDDGDEITVNEVTVAESTVAEVTTDESTTDESTVDEVTVSESTVDEVTVSESTVDEPSSDESVTGGSEPPAISSDGPADALVTQHDGVTAEAEQEAGD